MPDLPPSLAALLAELRRGSFPSPAEAAAVAERRIREYNHAAQAALGGLSPVQLSELSGGDWDTRGAIRISRGLALAEVGGAVTFFNARLMLRVIGELGLAKITPSGLLARSVVAILFEQMRWADDERVDTIRAVCKVINEYDAGLSRLRYLLHQLGLIRKRKGFLLTSEGRRMLADEHAGELYHRLFLTGFRELNMYDERPEQPAVIQDLPFALYQMGELAGDWIAPSDLDRRVWLGNWAADQLLTEEQQRARMFFTEYRLVWPLVGFGLLEVQYSGEGPRVLRTYQVRKTALFDRVVRFDWSGYRP